ncbi:type IV toxin-antitoxin system AbiEi family antitoxin domain-containing protein [Sphingomonas sp. AP4-R1]|uniref:type IV toxin-antitoxin system AbiEi family antitoxin domain-containing protein n=1 Tax=Sphingomonas sp. AP4-R1 TaxID=2735134 RepID=UPI001493962B|nr:type IV toxin-antitoxin system AbiEi family antitoxin domain-containing protein [Sphingomonas sp. AP4-R1]QJU59087.1 type IV toxin-antitoxin system AbiEi family antitoxin domain-containing protein [Sphingomonas sp. AP4-R1]
MSSDWRPPRALRPAERKVLRLLRLAAQAAATGPGEKPDPLADALRDHDASRRMFLTLDAPFIAPEEHDFIQMVAHLQRSAHGGESDDPIVHAAITVVACLGALNLRLPPPISPEPPALLKALIVATRATAAGYADVGIRRGTARARALELLDRQGGASREELVALGLSRQNLSLLVKAGLAVRIGEMFYRPGG